MNNTNATLTSQSYRQSSLGHGIHSGTHNGHIERDGACETGLCGDFTRQYGRGSRNYQYIVKGEPFFGKLFIESAWVVRHRHDCGILLIKKGPARVLAPGL